MAGTPDFTADPFGTGVVATIDAHAAGAPCRVIVDASPALQGDTMKERRAHFRGNFDGVRRSLCREPRGHRDMFGALLTPPARSESAFGLIFFDTNGYLDGCGHATLCSLAVQYRRGIDLSVPFDIDNPDGSRTRVIGLQGSRNRVLATLSMPPARTLRDSVRLEGHREVDAFLATCGNTYLVVESGSAGLPDLADATPGSIRKIGSRLRDAALRSAGEEVPEDLQVALWWRPGTADTIETAILFSQTQIDRSPCGTGSCSLLAGLMDRGDVGPGDEIRTVGPAGLAFTLAGEPRAGGDGYDVDLRGSAHVTGLHEWITSDDDPLAEGFLLEESSALAEVEAGGATPERR
jgi:proline racemase/trans-L-3-hydroxyproline dehydratase